MTMLALCLAPVLMICLFFMAVRFNHLFLSLLPLVLTLFLLQAGKIFFAAFGDWGLFYNLPMQSGILYTATDVIDTYVYNSLRKMNDFGMSTAVGLYQSVVGCALVLVSNWAVRRFDRESAIF